VLCSFAARRAATRAGKQSDPLDDHGRCSAAASAHGGLSGLPIAALQFLEQGADEDGAPPILAAARGRTMRAARAGSFSISNFFGRQD